MTFEIDDKYLDVDFTKDPHFVFGDLGQRAFRAQQRFEASQPLIPSSDWQKEIEATNESGGSIERLIKHVYDQGQEGSCFPPGTLVTMATGEVRPIEDVTTLSRVLTAEGNVGEVRQTMARPYIGQLVNVCLHGNNLLRCTPEHPILTARGYVQASQLTVDDWVAIPTSRPAIVSTIQTATYLPNVRRCVNETRVRQCNAPLGRTATSIRLTAVPDVVRLDKDFGTIVGLFLAEGNASHSKVTWTFNINERDTVAAELRRLLKERFDIDAKERVAGARCVVKIEVHGILWARLFESLCATGSGNKRLCDELASGPMEFRKAVFDAWMIGDGYRQKRTSVGVTISRQLAVQMFQIANACRMFPSLRRSVPAPNKSAKTRQPRYDLSFGNVEAAAWLNCSAALRISDSMTRQKECYRRQQDEQHCWRKVRLLVLEDYKGPVYNLHVHGDESYVADGIGVHNCVGNAICQAANIIQAIQVGDENVVILSPMSVYRFIGSTPQSGAMISDALDHIVDVGALPLDTPENAAKFQHVMPATGYYQSINQFKSWGNAWRSTAAIFKGIEAMELTSVGALVSASLRGFPIVVGREGHSICYVRPLYSSGIRFLYVNSWGRWGQGAGDFQYGFGVDSLSQVQKSAHWAFALRTSNLRSN